jgi:hypothetical protein
MLDFVIQVLSVLCILSYSFGSAEESVTDNFHSFSPYSFSSPSSFDSSSPSSSSSTLKPMVDMATRCGVPGIIKRSC